MSEKGLVMLVGRFSHTGFDPCFQSYMKKYTEHLLSWDKEETKRQFPGSWQVMEEGVKAGLKDFNHEFTFYGIHVFFLPLVDGVVEFQLNHLRAERPPYHEKWFEDDTPCHTLGSCWNKPLTTLYHARKEGREGVYIPVLHL